MGYEVIPHTADLAIKVWGRDLPEIFQSAVDGYRFLLAGDADFAQEKVQEIKVWADDVESLLVRFLNRLVFLFDTESFLPVSASFDLDGFNLTATVSGVTFTGTARHCIKAATYHGLSIDKVEGNLFVTIIFDD
jgi:SHS2 domain-containing protein